MHFLSTYCVQGSMPSTVWGRETSGPTCPRGPGRTLDVEEAASSGRHGARGSGMDGESLWGFLGLGKGSHREGRWRQQMGEGWGELGAQVLSQPCGWGCKGFLGPSRGRGPVRGGA